jgi:hypothetical protein
MNRFESVTDGTASHSTWLPNDGNQVDGYKPLRWLMALLLVAFVAGCGNGGGGRDPILGGNGGGTPDTTAPRLISTSAVDGAVSVPTNTATTATFSEAMRSSTLVSPSPSTSPATTFTVHETLTPFTPVAGVVTYINNTATFTPNSNLSPSTQYTSTITAGAKDPSGNALTGGPIPNPWKWTTGIGPNLTAPTVTFTNAADTATNVPVTQSINATFSEAMSPATMIPANFTVKETVSGTPVAGTVAYDVVNNIATFVPLSNLKPNTSYTAKVTSGAKDLQGNALLVPAVSAPNNPWIFTTAPVIVVVPLAINLRGAAPFGIASRAGLTSTGVTVVNGDVALYPNATCTDATGNAGAGQTCITPSGKYVSPTGMTVNGQIYYAGDPFDNGGTANSVTNDLNIAWTEGMNKVDTQAGVLVGQLGGPGPTGKILTPGVYHEAALGLAAGDVATFDAQGNANAIFIIKIDSSFVDSGTLLLPTQIKLVNGAQARNIWFVAGSAITIGSGTTWNGNILAGGTATILNGSTMNGRVLAGAAGAGAITLTGAASPSVTTISVP